MILFVLMVFSFDLFFKTAFILKIEALYLENLKRWNFEQLEMILVNLDLNDLNPRFQEFIPTQTKDIGLRLKKLCEILETGSEETAC